MDRKLPVAGVVVAAIWYLLSFVLCSTCGLIHPACYAYAGTLFPLLAAFAYLYVAANVQSLDRKSVV